MTSVKNKNLTPAKKWSYHDSDEYPKVAVFLAAYNGASWIEEQLATILSQVGVRVSVFVSLDYSSDITLDILQRYAQTDERLKVLDYGAIFGSPAKNFFRLAIEVDIHSYDFIALADQDDIWLPRKLFNATRTLSSGGFDAYSSDFIAFWGDGTHRHNIKSNAQTDYDYLFESAGPGCTYVMTSNSFSSLQQFIKANKTVIERVAMHDWLFYAYYRSTGFKWIISKNVDILYRQHSHNNFGVNNTFNSRLKRLNLIRSKWYRRQVEIISNLLGRGHVCSFPSRLWRYQSLRRNRLDRIFLLILFVIGFY